MHGQENMGNRTVKCIHWSRVRWKILRKKKHEIKNKQTFYAFDCVPLRWNPQKKKEIEKRTYDSGILLPKSVDFFVFE